MAKAIRWEEPCAPMKLAKCVVRFDRPKRRIIETFYGLDMARTYIETMIGKEKLHWESRREASAGDVTITSEQLEDIMESTGIVDDMPEPHPTNIEYFMGRIKRQERPVEPRRAVVKREKIAGAVTIAEIADELGKDVRKVRAYLRDEIEKPAQGWQWAEDEAEKIRKLVARMG